MKIMTRAATVAGMLALLSTAGVSAQDTTKVSKGEVDLAPSVTTLLATYQQFPATIEAIKKQEAIKGDAITLVDAATLATGESEQLLTVMLQKHATEIAELQKLLAAQPEITALLAKQSPSRTAADVIAAETKADGKLVLYVHTKKS